VTATKSQHIKSYTRKYKESVLLQFKIVAQFNDISMDKIFHIFYDQTILEKEGIDSNTHYVPIEKISDTRTDWHITTKAMFPIASREFIVAADSVWTPEHSFILHHSIERPEFPRKKGIIRGESKNYYSMTPLNEKGCTFTLVGWLDFKGKIPSWFINSQVAKGSMDKMLMIEKYLKNK